MTLEQLRIFVKVVDAGSFTRAADVLDIQRSNISRIIAQLEAEFGVTLLERTTRSQSISEAGRAIYERAIGVLAATEDMVRVTQQALGSPKGHLRVTCGVEFGMTALGSWVETFLERYPTCSAEIEYSTRELDLVHEGFDMAIRAGPLTESRLVARRLGQFNYGLYASPAYRIRAGLPKSPDGLSKHQLVVFTGDGVGQDWRLEHAKEHLRIKVQSASRLNVNAGASVRSAILRGLGVGQLPQIIAHDLVQQGLLVRVLPAWQPPAVPIFAVYPSNKYLTPKVRTFIDLALENFPHIDKL